jgi:hypothetical protein
MGTDVRGKILLPLPGIEPLLPCRPAISQTLLTELSRLLDLDVDGKIIYLVLM